MPDPRDYAPPAVRQQGQSDNGDYVSQAVGYVQDSVEQIKQDRAHVESLCEMLAQAGTVPPTPIDPIIDGLLAHVPRSGAVWPEADRKVWLSLLEGSFKLIYRESATTPPSA